MVVGLHYTRTRLYDNFFFLFDISWMISFTVRETLRMTWLLCGKKNERSCVKQLLVHFLDNIERKRIKDHLKMRSILTTKD